MKFIALFVTMIVVTLIGCGVIPEASADQKVCNLSSLKIKEIKINGDKDGFVARAVKSELYKFGARATNDGVQMVGSVQWSMGGSTPMLLSLDVPSLAFASVAKVDTVYMGMARGAEKLGQEVAEDFCACSSGLVPPRPLSSKK